MRAENVEFCWNSALTDIIAEGKVSGAVITDLLSGEKRNVDCDGIFVSIGRKPASEIFASQLTLDNSGYIVADESTKTNLEGVFAAGDVRTKTLRQVITAASDGAVAAHYAEEYLTQKR
jgi:thioredoxin reductase (NADPH)